MWKTGHSLIKGKMKELGAPLAGEMSGHMFFAESFYGHDDALYGAARLMRIVVGVGTTLEDLLADVPRFVSTPEIRIDCPDDRKFAIVDDAVRHFSRDHEVVGVDGARVLFGDGWGCIRASNTQPVLVARFEARTAERLGRDPRRDGGLASLARRRSPDVLARRWLIAAAVSVALLLLLGKALAGVYVDYRWFAALGAESIWWARVENLLILARALGPRRDALLLLQPVRGAPLGGLARAAEARREHRDRRRGPEPLSAARRDRDVAGVRCAARVSAGRLDVAGARALGPAVSRIRPVLRVRPRLLDVLAAVRDIAACVVR